MTKTLGYYNGNDWPINLVISELNVSLNLAPGVYVKDAQQRQINDSYFDRFVKPLQLSKAVSKTGEVPLIAITHPAQPAQGDHQHSVRSVPGFTSDRNGTRAPAPEPPKHVPQPVAVNTPTHRGMSVDEARKLGLIGKPREIPEDYGITDTAGHPVDASKAPPIRYAIESTPRVRQAEVLPAELTEMEGLDPRVAAQRTQLVGSLAKGARANIDSPSGFLTEATVHTPAPMPVPAQPAALLEEQLPQPNIFASDQIAPMPDPLAIARANAQKPMAEKTPAPKDDKPFICNVDGSAFKYRSQLESYAKRKFVAQLEAIMAPYPPPTGR